MEPSAYQTSNVLSVTKLGSLGTHEQYTDDGIPVNPHQLIVFAKVSTSMHTDWFCHEAH